MSSESYMWQSFDFPTDTRLPGMKLRDNFDPGIDQYLSSWRSAEDPSPGDFNYKIDNRGLPQMVTMMGSVKKYRSGPWNGIRFSGHPMISSPTFNYKLEFSGSRLTSISETYNDSIATRLKMEQSGLLDLFVMDEKGTSWTLVYTTPGEPCDNYGQCGPNGICKLNKTPMCECLKGFTPKSQVEWEVLVWSSGCVRKVPLDCHSGEGFVQVPSVKLPDLLEFQLNTSMSLIECKAECLKNCSCSAYANPYVTGGGTGCLMWFGNLVDIREFVAEGSEQDIYLRLPASELEHISRSKEKNKRLVKILVVLAISGVLILSVVCGCIVVKLMTKRRAQKRKNEEVELPLFRLATIAAATNNFSQENLIGRGGFGPVYKGQLQPEQEIAVKRLSNDSGQGLAEFKNEVVSIAKLQHINLVRILGCCIQGEERMLIYEYLHNKSLDYFIFGLSLRILSL
ncbi:unnamed protein product [Ilex paraguariensis]|uniref:non-specific serine/threonine protein kinase n=1 Tax=Ilex paraguariensis TaxID=185542 RepID=A0ABC8RPM4_9AQUA